MAEHDCNAVTTEEKVASAVIRRNKVSYARQYPDYTAVPALILKGKWLAAAGFSRGTMLDIRVMPHCLVIITRQPEQDDPEFIKSLRKLSARKQQQMADIIAAVIGRHLPKNAER